MGATYFKVEMREKGGENPPLTALGVLLDGRFVQAYGTGVGLRFFDHASAVKGMHAAQRYFEFRDRIAEWKVVEVHE